MTDRDSRDLAGAAHLARDDAYDDARPTVSDYACCASCYRGGRCYCDERAMRSDDAPFDLGERPYPGSDAARDTGCICPVLDNGHGNVGLARDRSGWVIVVGCPQHSPSPPQSPLDPTGSRCGDPGPAVESPLWSGIDLDPHNNRHAPADGSSHADARRQLLPCGGGRRDPSTRQVTR